MKYIVLIIVAAFIVGALGLNFPFAFDDFQNLNWVKENLAGLPILSALRSCFMPSLGGQFCPFKSVVDLISYRTFGLGSPFFYHLLAVLFHVVVALCCFVFANRITGNKLLSFVAAFLFAIFPYHYWSIWWIANSGSLLTFALFLASFFAFIKWIEGGGLVFSTVSFITVNLCFLTSSQGAIYPLAYLLYAIAFFNKIKRRKLEIFVFLFLVFICDKIWFSFKGNYAAGSGSIIGNALFHSLDIWQKILMFNIFTDPRVPAGGAITLFVVFILGAILFFDIEKSKKKIQFLFGMAVLLIGSLVFLKSGTGLFVKYLSAVFFVYYLIFGSKIERFFVCLTVIFAMIFFTVGKPMLCSRYLYAPNFAFSILFAILLIKNIDRLFVSPNIKKFFLIVFLCGFTLMSAVFYYDKFKDWGSVCNLEWEVLKDAAANASRNSRVIFANSSNLFRLDIPLNKWMNRNDLIVDYGYGVVNEGFYLGDAYFADFNNFKLAKEDKRFNHAARRFRQIRLGKINAFIYNKVDAVNFGNSQSGYFVLPPKNEIGGLVVNSAVRAEVQLIVQDGLELEVNGKVVTPALISTNAKGHVIKSIFITSSKEPFRLLIKNNRDRPLIVYSIKYQITGEAIE